MFVVAPAHANEVPSKLQACGRAEITSVITGDRMRIRDGHIIQLASIKAPELWQDDSGYKSWPYGKLAKEYLQQMIEGKPVALHCENARKDILGDQIRHIVLPSGEWLQKALVEAGMAFVHPSGGSGDWIEDLFVAERTARAEGVGIWSERGPDLLADVENVRKGLYQIVEFQLHQAAQVGTTLYLNTDENWREDFTVEINTKIRRKFTEQELDTLTRSGVKLEARGWVFSKSGPTIAIDHPNAIRVIAD